jgi:hypothetical protein
MAAPGTAAGTGPAFHPAGLRVLATGTDQFFHRTPVRKGKIKIRKTGLALKPAAGQLVITALDPQSFAVNKRIRDLGAGCP